MMITHRHTKDTYERVIIRPCASSKLYAHYIFEERGKLHEGVRVEIHRLQLLHVSAATSVRSCRTETGWIHW